MLYAVTWVDLEGIMLSEISQTEKDKYCMISLTCGIQKTKQKDSDTENKLVVARDGVWELDKQVKRIKRYKLQVIK